MQNHEEHSLVRLPAVLALIPVSKSSWWAGIKAGTYPAGIKLSPRVTAWRLRDILAIAERANGDAGANHTPAGGAR